MPQPGVVQRGAQPARVGRDGGGVGFAGWAEEELISRLLVAEAETPAAHEARCDRVARTVMERIAGISLPAKAPMNRNE